MNLVIDIGNSYTKLGIFDQSEILAVRQLDFPGPEVLDALKQEYPGLCNAIVSTVRGEHPVLQEYLDKVFDIALLLDEEIPIPIANLYSTRQTLGRDRIAAAVGASNIFPARNVLIVDAGTALTFDMVTSDGRYIGGNISPGLRMRFTALHQQTRSLPLLSVRERWMPLGNNTEDAIVSGVQQGMILEIEGFIQEMARQYDDLQVILTGGDCNFFENKLKSSIFVNQNLVLYGLNRILDFNVTR